MHRSLAGLLVRTRFTWYFLLMVGLIAIYSLYQIPLQANSILYNYSTLYFTGVFGVYTILAAVMGGISVSKSDQEFLLVSPISKRSLIPSLLIVQVLGSGLLLIAVTILSLASLNYGPPGLILSAVNLVLLDAIMISVGIATFPFSRKVRILFAAVLSAWVLSYLAGFPFAPQMFVEGHPLEPLLFTAPVAALSMVGAVRALMREDLPLRLSSPKVSAKEARTSVHYVDLTPLKAVFVNSITNLAFSTNSMMAGGIRTRMNKIRLRTYVIVLTLFAIAYGALAYFLIPYGVQSDGYNFVVLFGALYAGVLPQFVFNSGAMVYERAWLSFTSMEPWRYITVTVWAKVALSVLTSIPFIVVSILDYFAGVLNIFESILVFLVLDPLLIGLYLFVAFSTSYYQITDENFLSSRMTAAQFVPALPLILFTFIVIISILVPVVLAIAAGVSAVLLIYLTTRKEYWERKISRLVEKGFV